MSVSNKQDVNLRLQNIQFFSGSKLGDINEFATDVRFRKRIRVDGDLLIQGSFPYTDKQTGWGLPEWTFAQSGAYSVQNDSLISKISNIETNYATKQYVDSLVIGGTTGQGLVFYETNTYPQYADPTLLYQYPVTTLAQNSAFIFRDSQTTTMSLKFQKGVPAIGKVLTCKDTDGTVEWAEVSTQSSVISDTISSTNGQSNSFTFQVIDIGPSSSAPGVGWAFYPQLQNNNFNKSLLQNDIALLGGYNESASNRRVFIGPYSNGGEGISFKSSYSTTTNGVTTNIHGQTQLSGGYYNTSSGKSQTIQLGPSGVIIEPGNNLPVVVELPKITFSSTNDTWNKPFTTQGKWGNDQFPTLVCSKSNADGTQNHLIHFNPKLGGGSWNPLVQAGDMGIIVGDYTGFNWATNSTVYIEALYRFFIGPWSPYQDGIVIRPTLQSEETASPLPTTSGYVRISSGSLGGASNRYLEINREGIVILNTTNSKSVHYGRFDIQNKTGAIINNTVTNTVTGAFNVGTNSSYCVTTLNGSVYMAYGGIYMKPTSNTPVVGYVWSCIDSNGQGIWKILPTQYDALSVVNLSTASISTSELKIQDMTIFPSATGSACYYYVNKVSSSHEFIVNDSNNGPVYPLKLDSQGITISKPLRFSDNTSQLSAYTGAKSLAGSYTNTNLTIDANGRITALSSNPFYLPSDITTPVTFSSPVTFNNTTTYNDSFTFNPGSAKTMQLGQNVSFYANGNSYLYDLNVTNLAQTNTVYVIESYTPTVSSTALRQFNGSTWGTSDTVDLFPARNAIVYWMSYTINVGIARYPVPCTYIQEIVFPLRWKAEWEFLDSRHDNNEAMSVYVELTYYYIDVYKNGILCDSWKVDIQFPTSVNFYVQRYLNSTNYCNSSGTVFQVYLPFQTIKIRWAPPTGSYTEADEFSFQTRLRGRWINNGEYYRFISTAIEINSTATQESFQVTQGQNDIYATTALFLPNQYNCTNLQRNGNSIQPYETPGINPSLTNIVVANQVPYTNQRLLTLGNIMVNGLTLQNSITMPYGMVHSCGYAGRKGVPILSPYGNTRYDTSENEFGSSRAWGSYFNFYWTGSKWQIWVDYTLVYEAGINVSDHRRKSNVRLIGPVLDRIASLKVIQYSLKEYEIIQETNNHIGVFAHELQETFPECEQLVNGEKDAVDGNGKPVLQTISNEVVFLLLKSIQELKAENDRMKLQIETLFTLLTPPQ